MKNFFEKLGIVKKRGVKQNINEQIHYEETNFIKDEDPLCDSIVKFVMEQGKASASLLQRKFRLGYSRAAHYIDLLEERGIVGPPNGASPREVYIRPDEMIFRQINNSDNIYSIDEIDENQIDNYYKNFCTKSKYDVTKLENVLLTNIDDKLLTSYMKKIIDDSAPDDLKMICIEYLRMNFFGINGIPHLLLPVVNDSKKAKIALKRVIAEMERRYDVFEESKTKNIESYNNYLKKLNETLPDGEKHKKMPYINVIIDEAYNFLKDEEMKELLINIIINGKKTGIRCTLFSKFNKGYLNLGSLKDCVNIYDKFNVNKYFDSLGKEVDVMLESIDKDMNGFDFENYTKDLLAANGFDKVSVTKASNDFGVDVIAEKDSVSYAIQCKKYSSPVGIKAVQEVIGSKAMNQAHVAVVLTNNTFTKSAKELAKSNGVLLWDRNKLKEMIEKLEITKNRN